MLAEQEMLDRNSILVNNKRFNSRIMLIYSQSLSSLNNSSEWKFSGVISLHLCYNCSLVLDLALEDSAEMQLIISASKLLFSN